MIDLLPSRKFRLLFGGVSSSRVANVLLRSSSSLPVSQYNGFKSLSKRFLHHHSLKVNGN